MLPFKNPYVSMLEKAMEADTVTPKVDRGYARVCSRQEEKRPVQKAELYQ